jgi:peptidoglycan/xylan/chitin deacetylase (PgdA/CDA1 family)
VNAGLLARFLGASSMAAARGLRAARPSGVVVCGHTLGARAARFQVDTLGRWFDFIGHEEVLERILQPRARPFCLLTFDDGKRSNATELAPELERLGVPAVFYIVTEFLSSGAPLWFDRQAALVTALGRTPPGLGLTDLKTLPLARVEALLDRAWEEYSVRADLTSDDVRPMSWDEARRLARHGFTIGAHSLRHATLTNEVESGALVDIERSMAAVSVELGSPCRTFAFPNGNYTPSLAQHAVRHGAETVMTTEPMWMDARLPLWRIPRIQLFPEQSRMEIELKLAAAATGRLLVNPDGTGRQYARHARGLGESPPNAFAY